MVIATRRLFDVLFEASKDNLSFPKMLQLYRELLQSEILFDRDAIMHVTTKWLLKSYRFNEALGKWADLIASDKCLSGGSVLFGHLLSPNSKLKPGQKEKYIRMRILKNFEGPGHFKIVFCPVIIRKNSPKTL